MKKMLQTTIHNKMNFKALICFLFLPLTVLAQKMPEENYIQGYVFWQQEKYDSAIWYFDRSLKVNEKNADALFYRGLSYLASGNNQRAIQDLSEADKSDQGRAAIWIARIYARENNIDETLKYLDIHLQIKL